MSEQRKQDHIDLAFKSVPSEHLQKQGVFFEPLFGIHPDTEVELDSFSFAAGRMKLPFWVSSMTGGTEKAKTINTNLAKACAEFGMGMGLGSCRPLLEDKRWEDFDIRSLMGDEAPLYTNFGIAQLEELQDDLQVSKIEEITKRLQANGVIIHVNPLQEWAQPEGDRYQRPAIETIERFLDETSFPVIIKEVGQGFGPQSLMRLTKLPLQTIELAGFGGTNFTILEQARLASDENVKKELLMSLGNLGHSADEMIKWLNGFDFDFNCKQFIISGGVKDPVVGFMKHKTLKHQNVIGMASQFLKYSTGDYETLKEYLIQARGTWQVCHQFLKGIQ